MAVPSPLLSHLDTLYPAACVLVGPDHAPALLRRMTQQVADDASIDRPQDLHGWLRALLRAVEDESQSSPSDTDRPSVDVDAPDALRREAAQRIVKEALPTALAAASREERFHLAMSVLAPPDSPQDPTASSFPPSAEIDEWLWTTLEQLLSAPEYRIVESTLTTEALREKVQDLLTNRFPEPPGSLRTELRTILEAASEGNTESEETGRTMSLLARLPTRPTPQALLFTLLLGLLILAGGIGLSYLGGSSSPAPSESTRPLVGFSADQAKGITPDLLTNSPTEAEAYVDSSWNRRITPPTFDGASLRGVGRVRVANTVDVPVFLYGEQRTRIVTFAYNYALLRRIESTATLSRETRTALARSHSLLTDSPSAKQGVLWRHRDEVFVAVAPSLPPDSLRARLQLPE